jgi:predicted unusual protein kinase regulating ubiquinone biosynthesis (AarF/ABC1/UbiB family)
LVKPVATRLFNLRGKDSEKYFKEVEGKLLEETDYALELEQSKEITEACSMIPNLKFPNYYPEFSCDKILTMDWMEGIHLSEYTAQSNDPEQMKIVGQTLWDFYMYQMHVLKRVHADPHPGNFLVDKSGALVAIDFGCIKEVPEDFYVPYFEMAQKEAMKDRHFFIDKITNLEILRPDDSAEDRVYITDLFHELLGVLTFPFHNDTFDFSDESFWSKVAQMSERLSKDEQIRKLNGNRGSRHFLYINRTFFGLYNLLHDLKADIVVNNYKKFV